MIPDYVIELRPAFAPRPWGGRDLERWYPHLPPGIIGEAWALSARPEAPSVVANGPLAGNGLDLLFGAGERFPALIKLLHAAADLSVQVHPPDGFAGLAPGDSGKTELWLVLHALPGASIIHGLATGATVTDLARAVAATRGVSAGAGDRSRAILDCLRRVEVKAGDVVPIPPGTVHALGAGIIVAEVQQNSDTTYRLYDYDRPGLDGRPRALHLEQGLRAVTPVAPPEVFSCPAPGSLDRPAPLGCLPGGISVGYATLPAGDIQTPPALLALLVLEGRINDARPGHCLLMQPPGSADPGGSTLSSLTGATTITLHQDPA
jgi:hypothetical protein